MSAFRGAIDVERDASGGVNHCIDLFHWVVWWKSNNHQATEASFTVLEEPSIDIFFASVLHEGTSLLVVQHGDLRCCELDLGFEGP